MDAQAAVILALIGVAVGLVGVVLGAVAWFQLHRMRRSYALLAPVEGNSSASADPGHASTAASANDPRGPR